VAIQPDEYDGEGSGSTLPEAINAAWEDAKRNNKGDGYYEVKKIQIKAENPITEYKASIKKV
jgi:hypothetical protein